MDASIFTYVALRIASTGQNSMAKSLINAFVMNKIATDLDIPIESVIELDLYSTGFKHQIHDDIQLIADKVNEIPLNSASSGGFVPNSEQSPLYGSLLTALKRRKLENPDVSLIHEFAGDQINSLFYSIKQYVSAHKKQGSLMELPDYGSGRASVPRGASTNTAILRKRKNKKKDRVEWALVSPTRKDAEGKAKVLEWYGSRKPSDERVEKSEARIQWFSTGPGKKKKRSKKGKKRVSSTVSFPGFTFSLGADIMSSLYELPSLDDSGKITALSLYESIMTKIGDAVLVFYDTETTGLPNRLPNAQITQLSAVAVLGSISGDGVVKVNTVGEFQGTAELTDYSVTNLDAPQLDKGWTTRQTLEFNRYDLPAFEKHKQTQLPPTPPDYRSPQRRKTIEYPEYGAAVDVKTRGMPSGFMTEYDLLKGFIDLVDRVKSESTKVYLVAHNAAFDRKFIAVRCKENGLDCSTLNSCRNLDSQALMQMYIDPVVKVYRDSTVRDRFKELVKGRNMYNLDFVNSAFGTLSAMSHSSNADVESLIKALFKCLNLLRDAGTIDVTQELRSSVKSRHDLETRDQRSKQKRHEFKSKYLTIYPDDIDEVVSLKRDLHKVKSSSMPKPDIDMRIEEIIKQIDSLIG